MKVIECGLQHVCLFKQIVRIQRTFSENTFLTKSSHGMNLGPDFMTAAALSSVPPTPGLVLFLVNDAAVLPNGHIVTYQHLVYRRSRLSIYTYVGFATPMVITKPPECPKNQKHLQKWLEVPKTFYFEK